MEKEKQDLPKSKAGWVLYMVENALVMAFGEPKGWGRIRTHAEVLRCANGLEEIARRMRAKSS